MKFALLAFAQFKKSWRDAVFGKLKRIITKLFFLLTILTFSLPIVSPVYKTSLFTPVAYAQEEKTYKGHGVEYWIKELRDGDWDGREDATRALNEIGDIRAVPAPG